MRGTADHLAQTTVPFEVDPSDSVAEVLKKMGRTSFQSRNLATALSIWSDMLNDKVIIFMGLAGAMTAGGMRKLVSYLIENRYVDVIVSTGANLFHDMHESLGRYHFMGTHQVNDVELQELGIDRIFDTYAKEKEFRNLDQLIGNFSLTLDLKRPYTTREFFYLLGEKIWSLGKQKGIVTSAYRAGIPIYCPAVADSSVGIALATKNAKTNRPFNFNVIQDVQETAYLVAESSNAAIISVGGGTPKNFIQQAEVTASIHLGIEATGFKYCVQITTDAPHWGGLSGCTFQESQSWGKINKRARMVAVYSDATIALPILATAITQVMKGKIKRRRKPGFVMGPELKLKW